MFQYPILEPSILIFSTLYTYFIFPLSVAKSEEYFDEVQSKQIRLLKTWYDQNKGSSQSSSSG